jgi:choline-sulfatase
MPWRGKPASWHHRLREGGHTVTSIGKLHFRAADDDNGFTEELLPLHVLDGVGDLIGAIREPPPRRGSMPALAASAGAGDSSYNRYDIDVTAEACAWLQRKSSEADAKPWALFVSLVRPHFPLTAPPEFFALYDPDKMPMPRLYGEAERAAHPAVKALRAVMDYDDHFRSPAEIRLAIASYYALVSFLDDNIGKILAALDDSGAAGSTRVIYTSDHGDNLGCRGLWGKSVMYEESAAIPMIAAGAGVPVGAVVDTPVSLVDIHRSAVECVGCAPSPDDAGLPSRSLWSIANGERPERAVISEYHAAASVTGTFMVRHGRWKYIHHVGYAAELFDLATDPGETTDLAARPGMEDVLAACEARLRTVCDPNAVNARAFADQRALIAAHGGRDAIIARGDYSYTPAPGEKPVLVVSGG